MDNYNEDYLAATFDVGSLKVPPHSVEAEQAVIGGLLISSSAFDLIADAISESDFYRHEHRVIFSAVSRLAESGKPHDAITVHDALATAGDLERAGGFAYLLEMASNTASAANIRSYAEVVKDKAILRSLAAIGDEIASSAYQTGGKDTATLLDEAQAAVMSIGDTAQANQDLHVSTTLRAYIDELERRLDANGIVGLSSGFEAIDRRTNGFMGGDLVVVGGRPKSGKTTFAMNIAENVAVVQGNPVLVFSMEMSRMQLVDRMTASVGGIPFNLLRSGRVFGSDYEHLIGSAVGRIKNSPLYIDDRPALTVGQMRSAARRQHRKTPLALIVVDYIQLARAKSESRVMEITMVSQGLKALAKELNCPVVALSQLSRKCEEQKRRPMASDLRDSGSIEQDADAILMIYRDKVYNEDSHMGDTAEIIIPALRNGEAGTDYLEANLAMCRFENKHQNYTPPEEKSERSYRKSRSMDY